jgi:NADH-quinone oxidoreductase subunit N
MFTNLGAFAVVMAVEKDDGTGTELEDLVGLSKSQPMLAFMMMIFLLSLIGIPATGGFMGKWFVFLTAVEAKLYTLAVVGVLTSVVSAFYYMRPMVNMFLRNDEADGDPAEGATPYVKWAIYICATGVLIVGIAPGLATGLVEAAANIPLF